MIEQLRDLQALEGEYEERRLQALHEYSIIDTPPEQAFDSAAEFAAKICKVPIAAVSFVDSRRQWLKANVGLAKTESPREVSFCSHAIAQKSLFMVPDARADQRFNANPLVTGPPHIASYAGAPLITPKGYALGTLCVIDHVPRRFNEDQCDALLTLSSQLMAQLELRRTTEALRASEEFKSRLIASGRDCIKVLDLQGRLLFMNEGGMQALEICDFSSVVNRLWIEFWQGEDRESAQAAIESALKGEAKRFVGYFATAITGEPRWWDVVVSPIFDARGEPERLLAVSRDITARIRHETAFREASQLNQQIIDSAAQGIMVCDSELRYRVFNPFMEKLTGKRADDVIGKCAVEVFPSLRTSGLEQLSKRALNGEVVQSEDVLLPRLSATGRDVWESCTYAPHRDAQGNIVGIIALVCDMTERHVAEEMFRSIVVGTASATGADFFPSLVRHLATALSASYAFIAECDDQKHARSLAFWKDDEFQPNFSYDLAGTPCERVAKGEICYHSRDLKAAFPENQYIQAMGTESYLGIPMLDHPGHVIGHLVVVDLKPTDYDVRQIDVLKVFAARAAAELKRQRAETKLKAALEQVQALQQKIEAENVYLQEEIRTEHNFEEIVGNSPGVLDVLRRVETVAPTDATVLILGETGCGKELIARAIHSRSNRKHRPLVKLNCGAIPTGLVESELFGHRKGAFTGALENRTGRFELADGGTLFLDEVSELPLEIQVKLLRVLQEQEFEPLGTSRTIRVNVRIIAATNRDLEKAVKEGRFRADLYYRLNVLPVSLPPLRQRRSDIPILTAFFMERFSRQMGKQFTGITRETVDLLSQYDWPGNIRELQNVIERAVVLSPGPALKLGQDLLPAAASRTSSAEPVVNGLTEDCTLQELEIRHIRSVLNKVEWVIEGPSGAAQIVGLHPNTLRSRMKKLGIVRSRQ